jgi:hypothetical protein
MVNSTPRYVEILITDNKVLYSLDSKCNEICTVSITDHSPPNSYLNEQNFNMFEI